jgi:cytochrome c oxidase subunit I
MSTTTTAALLPGELPAAPAPVRGNHAPDEVRRCETTGLPVCLTAQRFIRLNAVSAVVFLTVGAIAAILLGLTRWPAVHLLPAEWYYRALTLHGFNMLIFWILFMEVGILYFACTTLLNSRLAWPRLAAVSFGLMATGALTVNAVILAGKADVLLTSYAPLQAHPLF